MSETVAAPECFYPAASEQAGHPPREGCLDRLYEVSAAEPVVGTRWVPSMIVCERHAFAAVVTLGYSHLGETPRPVLVRELPEEGAGRAELPQSDPAPSGLGSPDDPTRDGPDTSGA